MGAAIIPSPPLLFSPFSACRPIIPSVVEEEGARRLAERLSDFSREFPRGAVWAAHPGGILSALQHTGKCSQWYAASPLQGVPHPLCHGEVLPYAPGALAVLVSSGLLQIVNDVPGHLAQARRALAPGGVFLAMFYGGASFHELRHVLALAEHEVCGGMSPRVIPTIDSQAAAGLLSRAGFSLPVSDHETLTLTYPSLAALMREFRTWGWTNRLHLRQRTFTPRRLFAAAEAHYQALYPARDGQGLRLTVEFVYLMGGVT